MKHMIHIVTTYRRTYGTHGESNCCSHLGWVPREKVHVYDAVLQHAKLLLNLPRPSKSGVSEEDDEFVLQVQANILPVRALKTYYMGVWSYFYPAPQARSCPGPLGTLV